MLMISETTLILRLLISKCTGCHEGDVHLASGLNSNEGRVEICIGNQYGTVCDRMWDTTDASVVCRQLGWSYTGT